MNEQDKLWGIYNTTTNKKKKEQVKKLLHSILFDQLQRAGRGA
jgi:hypothetical protein